MPTNRDYTTAQMRVHDAQVRLASAEAEHARYGDDETAADLADAQTVYRLALERMEQLEAQVQR